MERNVQIVRVLTVKSILEESRFGLTVTGIYNELVSRGFQVTVRTIYRDIQALTLAGVPIVERTNADINGTVWRVVRLNEVPLMTVKKAA